jgi:hypothetical protein
MVDYLHGRDAAVSEIELMMVDALLYEVAGIIGLVIKSHHSGNPQFFKNRDIVIRRESSILPINRVTPYLSTVLSEGELNATNLLGMIQFKSPF